MEFTKLVRMLLAFLAILGLGLVASPADEPAPATGSKFARSLQRPPFLSTVNAQTSPEQLDIGEYLDEEAGISAWYKSPMTIDLDDVKGQYQIIELKTANYIIGSVSVPGYNDYWDQHVYVHVDGWILAYYLNTELTGRMIDALGHTINSTLLENTVAAFAGVAGVPYTGATLYDFRYPSGTHMLFVYEDDAGGSTYTINMPESYAYFERSWAKHNTYTGGLSCTFRIDGVQAPVAWAADPFCIGTIPYAQLSPGVTHTADVDGSGGDYVVLIVTYAVP
jgi:hypothetical protein